MSSRFIGPEDWEGENGNSVATEDNDYDADAGEYVCVFGGCATPSLRGAFREDNTDDNDDEDK